MHEEQADGGTIENWSAEEVRAAVDAGDIVLIDVRTPQEYLLEHIDGAILAPMPNLKAKNLPTQDGKRIVFHCGSGARSRKVAEMCLREGMNRTAHLEGGFGAWKKAGLGYIGTDFSTGAPKNMGGN